MAPGKDSQGVLLLGFGGAQSMEEVDAFLRSILGESRATPIVIERAREKYRAIGGRSPLPSITERQARSLQSLLGEEFIVQAGFLHSPPRIPEAMGALAGRGVTRVLGVSLSPHESAHSSAAYRREAEAAARAAGIKFRWARSWHLHPLYLSALAEKVSDGLSGNMLSHLLITAHSLPAGGADVPEYTREIGDTIVGFLKVLKDKDGAIPPWSLAYQSRGMGGGEWLGPWVEDALVGLASRGVKHILVLPLSFASDHLETLYDVDILYRKRAESLGMTLKRVRALNDAPQFIQVLEDVVRMDGGAPA